MFDGLILFGKSIGGFLTVESIVYVLLSSLVGVVIGALPGLTATMGVALMTTLTLKLPPNQALLILICTYVGAIYGGSRAAPFCSTFPARRPRPPRAWTASRSRARGLPGRAMGIATTGSVLGTLIGMFFLALFTPMLGNFALNFGAYEFFWLAVFGVVISGNADRRTTRSRAGSPAASACFVATIGQESVLRLRALHLRQPRPCRRLSLVPALVGAFGFAELLIGDARARERRCSSIRSTP